MPPENCLLLVTQDNRHFFTDTDNCNLLIEFSKTFRSELSVVKPEGEVQILTMEELAKSLCDQRPTGEAPKYQKIEVKIARPLEPAEAIRDRVAKTKVVMDHITESFKKGETLKVSEVHEKFPFVSESTIYNYLTRVRLSLTGQGYKFTRQKGGRYQATPPQI